MCIVVAEGFTTQLAEVKLIESDPKPRTLTVAGTVGQSMVKEAAALGAIPLTYATGFCVDAPATYCGEE